MRSGEVLIGTVEEGADETTLLLHSDLLGTIRLPREQIAQLTFADVTSSGELDSVSGGLGGVSPLAGSVDTGEREPSESEVETSDVLETLWSYQSAGELER